jgi:DNA-binding response OmpR family regulator
MTTLLVYSNRSEVRNQVRTAVGRLPDPALGPVEYLEVDGGPAVIDALDHGDADVCVFDGEATPSGGMGLCRQLKNEVPNCPPVVMLVARRDDRWLATWSQADAVVPFPLDPGELTDAVVSLLRDRANNVPARRPVTHHSH